MSDKDTELKPCPVCECSIQIHRDNERWCVHPRNNECFMSLREFYVTHWNKRPIEDKLRGRIEELENALKWSITQHLETIEHQVWIIETEKVLKDELVTYTRFKEEVERIQTLLKEKL